MLRQVYALRFAHIHSKRGRFVGDPMEASLGHRFGVGGPATGGRVGLTIGIDSDITPLGDEAGASAAESGLCKERAHGSRGAHGRYDLGGRNHRLLDISAAERLNQSDVGRLPSRLTAFLVLSGWCHGTLARPSRRHENVELIGKWRWRDWLSQRGLQLS